MGFIWLDHTADRENLVLPRNAAQVDNLFYRGGCVCVYLKGWSTQVHIYKLVLRFIPTNTSTLVIFGAVHCAPCVWDEENAPVRSTVQQRHTTQLESVPLSRILFSFLYTIHKYTRTELLFYATVTRTSLHNFIIWKRAALGSRFSRNGKSQTFHTRRLRQIWNCPEAVMDSLPA